MRLPRLRKTRAQEVDTRLDRAERIARNHAMRLLRLEAEAGIYRHNPITPKERRA
jgi:hypothetical protein